MIRLIALCLVALLCWGWIAGCDLEHRSPTHRGIHRAVQVQEGYKQPHGWISEEICQCGHVVFWERFNREKLT